MSQKTNPLSLRIEKGYQNFSSPWFTDFFFTEKIQHEFSIRKYIYAFLEEMQYSKAFFSIKSEYRKTNILLGIQDTRVKRKDQQLFFNLKSNLSRHSVSKQSVINNRLPSDSRKHAIKSQLKTTLLKALVSEESKAEFYNSRNFLKTKRAKDVLSLQCKASVKTSEFKSKGEDFNNNFTKPFPVNIPHANSLSERFLRKKSIFFKKTSEELYLKAEILKALKDIEKKSNENSLILSGLPLQSIALFNKNYYAKTDRRVSDSLNNIKKKVIPHFIEDTALLNADFIKKENANISFSFFFRKKVRESLLNLKQKCNSPLYGNSLFIGGSKNSRVFNKSEFLNRYSTLNPNKKKTFFDIASFNTLYMKQRYLKNRTKDRNSFAFCEKVVTGESLKEIQNLDLQREISSIFPTFFDRSFTYDEKRDTPVLKKGTVHLEAIRVIDDNQSVTFLLDQIVLLLEKRVSFKEIKRKVFKDISTNKLVKGIRISCSGRLGGRSKKAQKSKTQSFQWGETSLNTFSSKVVFANKGASTSYGKVGVKVWLFFTENMV